MVGEIQGTQGTQVTQVTRGIRATRVIRVECALPVLSQQTQPPYMEGSLL